MTPLDWFMLVFMVITIIIASKMIHDLCTAFIFWAFDKWVAWRDGDDSPEEPVFLGEQTDLGD